jgi:hypothetical protein
MSDDNLAWLTQWYLHECKDDWEHSYGVKIDTLDNPGWTLKIDLRETELQGRPFNRVQQGVPAADVEEWRKLGSWWVADVLATEMISYRRGALDMRTDV